jgi:3-oxoacyl-[acyl-carrier protein] reductase
VLEEDGNKQVRDARQPPPRQEMVFELTDSRALVTGAGSVDGIGFASTRMLAEMGASGYLTGASDRVLERASELTALGFSAHASTADLNRQSSWSRRRLCGWEGA